LTNSKRLRNSLLVGLLGCATAAHAQPASADSDLKLGLGSAVSSLLYAPAKALYASAGVLFGGIAWGLSGGDREVADAVMNPAVRGDYVVTPAHLRGERKLAFMGAADDGQVDPSATGSAGEEDAYSQRYYEPDSQTSYGSESPASSGSDSRGFYGY
jgi:hypothetical protein